LNNRQTVWITGAGSGIGRALALAYAKRSFHVILSGRKEESLRETEQFCKGFDAEISVVPFDLTEIDYLSSVVEAVRSSVSSIDILINNGGIGQRSMIAETPLKIDRQIFETNYFGTIEFTKKVLPWMLETGGGTIAVVSSISGLFGFPLRSSYAASKHALSGYFETLGLEHINDNIHTCIIYPGRIHTDISKNAITASGEPQNQMDKGQRDGMSADLCAEKILRGIRRKKRTILVGGKELLLAQIHRFLPRLFWKIAPKIDPR